MPDFVAAPGKVRASPLPDTGGGDVTHPANVTVAGTALYVFTNGVRTVDGRVEVYVSALPRPTAPHPGRVVHAWLGKGESLPVAGLRVTVVGAWAGHDLADVKVTSASR